jgi:dihydroorotate dehydrogenase electron transfer subunit
MGRFLLILEKDFDIFVLAIEVYTMHIEQGALIVQKQSWNDYFLLRVREKQIAQQSQPGQFIMVRPTRNLHPLLRRPFSIHSVRGDCLEIFFIRSGIGTTLLSQMDEGDSLDILGPLGKGFLLDQELQDKTVALVGGGRGIAPLYFLAQRLLEHGTHPYIFYGGKTLSDLPLKQKFLHKKHKILFSTDDGSFEFKGFVCDLFQRELDKIMPSHIYACGPEAMMKKIAEIAQKKSIPAEFSLESIMGCGFGACWGCVRKIKKDSREEWVKICEEGPVFPGHKIIWQDEEP